MNKQSKGAAILLKYIEIVTGNFVINKPCTQIGIGLSAIDLALCTGAGLTNQL